MTFDKWFDQYEWWHRDDCYNAFYRLWARLNDYYNGDTIQVVWQLDEIISVMKSEYGE